MTDRADISAGVIDGSAATDEELVRRVQQGDRQAWCDFLERHTDLIYRKAREYSRSGAARISPQDREDETGDLYLFMAETLRRSLQSFRLSCRTSTWLNSVLGNRRQIIKAYLMQKDPSRADVRLPKVMASRSDVDKEIFRRLVWGLNPADIARDVGVDVEQCARVEALLCAHSPRVYERIQGNRRAREPKLRLDEMDESGTAGPVLQVADQGLSAEEQLHTDRLDRIIQQALLVGGQKLSIGERRLLVLLYNHGMSAAEILDMARADDGLGLGEVTNLNRCYYLKDRALDVLAAEISDKLQSLEAGVVTATPTRRDILKSLEELLRERGFPTGEM